METERDLPFARAAFALLFTVNFCNYIDRYVLAAVFPLIQKDMHVSDAAMGFLASAFMIVYMFAAPVAGWLGDKWLRPRLMGAAALVWSAATSLAGFAGSYAQLLAARSAVGTGEAGFVSVSQSYVSELFAPQKRARVMALFTLVVPAGSAAGYILGALIGQHFGWRAAFFALGLPGALLAFFITRLPDPRRHAAQEHSAPSLAEYLALAKNKVFLASSFTQAAATFCVGGLSAWMPSYFVRYFGFDVGRAGMTFGAITVVAGIAGTWLGGWLADVLSVRYRRAYYYVSAAGLAMAAPLALAAASCSGPRAALTLFFAAEVCVFMHGGPMNAAIVKCTARNVRAMAFAASIFIIHAFGDAVSPFIIGKISDEAGLRLAVMLCSLTLLPAAAIAVAGGRADRDPA
ncbi:MAG: MFS transporter [Elusimicrobiales bacterium]